LINNFTVKNAKKKTKNLIEILRHFAEEKDSPCETLFSFPA